MWLRLAGISTAFILLLTALVAAQGGQSDSLTLDQAIKMVTENHPAVAQAIQGVAASEAQIVQSRSGFYPQLAGNASYAYIGPVPTFEIPGVGAEELAPHNNYNFHVGLQQTVYDFGRRSTAVELAQTGRNTALEGVEAAKSNLSYQTVEVFYAILFLKQNISVIDDQISTLNQHLEITRKKVQAGTATDFEVLTTEVRIANAQSQRTDIVNALENQESLFRQLTGLPENAAIMLKGDFNAPAININPDSLKDLALSQIPEMKQSKYAETGADIQYKLAALGNRPTVGVNLMFGFKNGYVPGLNTLKANWVAGVEVQAPIFNGFMTRGRKSQAQANLSAVRAHTKDLERRIISAVNQAISGVRASQSKLVSAEPQVRQAEQALSLAQTRYSAGTATNLDLLDAETALANARLVQLRDMYELVRNSYTLERAVGGRIW